MAIKLVYSIHNYGTQLKEKIETTVWLHGTTLISISKHKLILQIVSMLFYLLMIFSGHQIGCCFAGFLLKAYALSLLR